MKHCVYISFLTLMLWSCRQHTDRLVNYDLHGIDVSHYQSNINWDTVAQQDITFAFVKATEGITYNDSLYCRNWDEMKRVGLKRGAYHFFLPSISAEAQARNFTDLVEMDWGDLPPVLDVEVQEGVSKVALISSVRNWLYLVEIHYDVKPIIYTNLKFYNTFLAGHFNDYPVWIARYNRREPTLVNGQDWQFWQYGNKGRLNGIKGNVDFNVFNGTLAELEALCLTQKPVLSGLE